MLKQWIALRHTQTCTGFAPQNIVIFIGINEFQSSFCATVHYLTVLVHTKKDIHPSGITSHLHSGV